MKLIPALSASNSSNIQVQPEFLSQPKPIGSSSSSADQIVTNPSRSASQTISARGNIDMPGFKDEVSWRGRAMYTLLGGLATSFLIGLAAHRINKLWTLDQIENIDCHHGKTIDGITYNFAHYKNNVERHGNAIDQFCLAKMFEQGIEVERSTSTARKLFKEATQQGLFLANQALCRPSMFFNNSIPASEISDLKALCCSESLCPWHPIYQTDYINNKDDGTTHYNRLFGSIEHESPEFPEIVENGNSLSHVTLKRRKDE